MKLGLIGCPSHGDERIRIAGSEGVVPSSPVASGPTV